jgi:hypothetical protein
VKNANRVTSVQKTCLYREYYDPEIHVIVDPNPKGRRKNVRKSAKDSAAEDTPPPPTPLNNPVVLEHAYPVSAIDPPPQPEYNWSPNWHGDMVEEFNNQISPGQETPGSPSSLSSPSDKQPLDSPSLNYADPAEPLRSEVEADWGPLDVFDDLSLRPKYPPPAETFTPEVEDDWGTSDTFDDASSSATSTPPAEPAQEYDYTQDLPEHWKMLTEDIGRPLPYRSLSERLYGSTNPLAVNYFLVRAFFIFHFFIY